MAMEGLGEKGYDMLLPEFAKVPQRIPTGGLMIIGKRANARVERLIGGWDWGIGYHPRPHQKSLPVLRRAKLFVLPQGKKLR